MEIFVAGYPFGYEISEFEGYLKPIDKELNTLKKYTEAVKNKHFSLPRND